LFPSPRPGTLALGEAVNSDYLRWFFYQPQRHGSDRRLLPVGKRLFSRTVQQINGWRDLPKTISARIPAQ
jgi:hypothetical protein